MYESAMLKRGEMDERIFVPDDVAAIFHAADNGMKIGFACLSSKFWNL